MGAWSKLKAFAGSRNGKIALGGSAVGGVVIAGLVTRRRAGGDPTAPGAQTYAPPYQLVSGEGAGSGVNLDTVSAPGIDVGAFEQMLTELGRLSDAWEERNNEAPAPSNPAPAPATPRATIPAGAITITKGNRTLADIARQYYGDANHASYIVHLNTRLGSAWGDLSSATSKIVLPATIGGTTRRG